jgi:hypothetical protein
LWDLFAPSRNCINTNGFILGISVLNTVTDLLATLIPFSLILRLHLPVRQKIATVWIFGLGVLVNVAGAVRTYFVYQIMVAPGNDISWGDWPIAIAAIIEIGLGLVGLPLRHLNSMAMDGQLRWSSREE